MTSAGEPTKHHYIPKFLLRNWAGLDGRIERYDRPFGTKIMAKRVFPSEVGWSKNLYASEGHRLGAQWLEMRVFQVVDDRAAPVLRKLNTVPVPSLTAEERSAWTVFLRSLFHRTPENLRATMQSGLSVLEGALDDAKGAYDSLRLELDPLTFEEYRANLTKKQRLHQVQNTIPNMMVSERLGTFFNKMPSRIIALPDHAPHFLISDDPMARTNGLQTEGGHFAIPISPRRLFVSAWQVRTLNEISAMSAKELATSMNRWVVESARHFVAACDRSQDRFIRNRFGLDPKQAILAAGELSEIS